MLINLPFVLIAFIQKPLIINFALKLSVALTFNALISYHKVT